MPDKEKKARLGAGGTVLSGKSNQRFLIGEDGNAYFLDRSAEQSDTDLGKVIENDAARPYYEQLRHKILNNRILAVFILALAIIWLSLQFGNELFDLLDRFITQG